MKDITKLELIIISISKIITICAYNIIAIYSIISKQLALNIKILVLNFWICKNSAVSTLLALLACY